MRWHGRGKNPWYNYRYSIEELKKWVPVVQKVSDRVQTVYGYFNNHYHGYAPENCIEVLSMLELTLPKQIEIRDKIIRHNMRKGAYSHAETLEEYVSKPDTLRVEDLIQKLTNLGRIERAKSIRDEELDYKQLNQEHITATIRGYSVEICLPKRIISHDCEDWRKGLTDGRLCKHLCKLFINLPREKTVQTLTDLIDNKSSWTFKYDHGIT